MENPILTLNTPLFLPCLLHFLVLFYYPTFMYTQLLNKSVQSSPRNRTQIQECVRTRSDRTGRRTRNPIIDMEASIRITIRRSRIRHAPIKLRIRRLRRIIHENLYQARSVRRRLAKERRIPIRGILAPIEFSVRLGGVVVAQGAVPAVVCDGVEAIFGGEGKSFTTTLCVEVVGHVGGGVGERPVGAGVGVWSDL